MTDRLAALDESAGSVGLAVGGGSVRRSGILIGRRTEPAPTESEIRRPRCRRRLRPPIFTSAVHARTARATRPSKMKQCGLTLTVVLRISQTLSGGSHHGEREIGSCPGTTPSGRGRGHGRGVSDCQLLARFNAHRDELAEIAFTALVRRHGPMVLRVCRQVLGDWHTAEDAFQATFLILRGGPDRSTGRSCWDIGFMAWPCGRRGRRGCGTSAGGNASPPEGKTWALNRSVTLTDPSCHWSLARSSRLCTRRCPDCPNGIASPSCSASWRV